MLIGNLTRDPEVRYTPKGTAVAELGLAVNRSWTTDQGEKREEVTFVDVTVWGRGAEIAGEYMKKGRQIFVEGRLQLDSWDDKQSGQKRSKLRVIAESTLLLGNRQQGGGGGGGDEESESFHRASPTPPRSQSSAPPARTSQPPKDPDLDVEAEDDIPF